MLEHTFCHIPGFGPGTEKSLWRAGLSGWADLAAGTDIPLSPQKQATLHTHVRESATQLQAGNADYFYRLLPSAEQWRLFPAFRHQVAYFDIETTGLGDPADYITTIVLYDGRDLRAYVQGQNLDDFARDIAAYRLLVTYNGKTFDAPFVRRCLGAPLDQPHIDLRYVLGSLGYRGGLKGCERQLGIPRQGLEDVDGFFAVLLWHDYQRGNPKALDTLLAYNALDVINLEALMVLAYNAKLDGTPFGPSAAGSAAPTDAALPAVPRRLPAPERPPLPFDADQPTIRRLKSQHGWRPF